jgi:hypothetical protein
MGCGGSKPDKIQELDKLRRPCVKAFPRGEDHLDTRNKLPHDVFQEFEKIIKACYSQQPEALKKDKDKAKIATQNNQMVMHTAKPPEEQVSKTVEKEPPVAKAPSPDIKAGNVTESKGAGNGTTSHVIQPKPVDPVVEEHKSNEASASHIGKEHQEIGKLALSENIVEFHETEEADSARSRIAAEESRSDIESEAEVEGLDVTTKRLEKERLAQEEAMRRAAELKKKQDEELEAKKKKLTQIQGDANDILSKYK